MEPDPEAAPLLPPGVTKRQSKLVLKCFAGLVVLLLVLVFAVGLPAAGKADIPDRHHHPGHKGNTSLPVVRSGSTCSSSMLPSPRIDNDILQRLAWYSGLGPAGFSYKMACT